mgnify:CR=1 FL=1
MDNILNPFDITFGKEPISLISRENDTNIIKESFLSKQPDSQIYILTGLRGSGKTVALTTISNEFKQFDNWLVVDINPETEILEQLASKIYDAGKLVKLFLKTEFSFSFKSIGFGVRGGNPVSNVSTFLMKEFEYLKKKNINVLIAIDEVSSNEHMKIFAHEFQIFLRNNYNAFLIMTGLYQNIHALENEKTLTFLKRAPKIQLSTLNMKAIVNSYKRIFKINEEESIKLAKLTNGYSFAYQLLGDLLFKSQQHELNQEIIDKFDELIQERSYSIIYSELTNLEKDIIKSICRNDSYKAVKEDLDIEKNLLSNYKKVLIDKGLLDCSNREKLTITLPRFKEFVNFLVKLED